MAVIDKIYGTREQLLELIIWLKENKPFYLKFVSMTGESVCGLDGPVLIAEFNPRADRWLIENCPIEWLQKRLREQYGNLYDLCKIKQIMEKRYESNQVRRW